jgi:predicted O-methyltransferase YrrM
MTSRFSALRHTLRQQLAWLGRRLTERYPLSAPPKTLSSAVTMALALRPEQLPPAIPDRRLSTQLQHQIAQAPFRTSHEIFFVDGQPMPCWLPEDLTTDVDWLTSPRYYPLYHALFAALSHPDRPTRMLEIGVRTGYMGVNFGRAARGPSLYVGLDPNVYLADGLVRAALSLRMVRNERPCADFMLLKGFSWERDVQHTLEYSETFDIIHIDGDHSLVGKLIDLNLARQVQAPSGVTLLDDFDHHPPIADAVRRALALGWFGRFAYLPTVRGLAVLADPQREARS